MDVDAVHQGSGACPEPVEGPAEGMRFWYLLTIEGEHEHSLAGRRARRTDTVALPSCHIQLAGRKPLPPAYPLHMETQGDHLRKRRLDLGLFQSEVADELGVDETTICN